MQMQQPNRQTQRSYLQNGPVQAESADLAHSWDGLVFRLRSLTAVRGDGEAKLKPQLLYQYALAVLAGGQALVTRSDEHFGLEGGTALLARPGQTFGAESAGGEGMELYVFHFEVYRERSAPPRRLVPVKDVPLFAVAGPLDTGTAEEALADCGKLCDRLRGREMVPDFRCQLLFQELLLGISERTQVQPEGKDAHLERARREIETRYAEPLTAELLARTAGLSAKYFADLFKQKFGTSVTEAITGRRLKEAKRLMTRPELKISDIAHAVGYADEFYFSRKFKKEIGVAPAVYMKSRSRRIAAYGPSLLGYMLPLNRMPFAAMLHPKWTEYYYRHYRDDIPAHISAYRAGEDWKRNVALLEEAAPDEIIAVPNLTGPERLELERLAPVRYMPEEGEGWRKGLLHLAAITGESWQAEQWLAGYGRLVRRTKETVHWHLEGEPVAVVRMLGDKLFLHCNPGMAELFYGELDLPPMYAGADSVHNREVGLEELNRLPSGYLLMLIRQDSETIAEWDKLRRHPRWLSIAAVQRHRVRHLPSDPWREYSPHAAWRMLEQVSHLFSADCPAEFRR